MRLMDWTSVVGNRSDAILAAQELAAMTPGLIGGIDEARQRIATAVATENHALRVTSILQYLCVGDRRIVHPLLAKNRLLARPLLHGAIAMKGD
jgi:hypothetical protein